MKSIMKSIMKKIGKLVISMGMLLAIIYVFSNYIIGLV